MKTCLTESFYQLIAHFQPFAAACCCDFNPIMTVARSFKIFYLYILQLQQSELQLHNGLEFKIRFYLRIKMILYFSLVPKHLTPLSTANQFPVEAKQTRIDVRRILKNVHVRVQVLRPDMCVQIFNIY